MDEEQEHGPYPYAWLRRITPHGEILYLSATGWTHSQRAARRIIRHEAERLQGELIPIVGHVELEDAMWA